MTAAALNEVSPENATSTAAVLTAPERFAAATVPLPVPQAGQVRVAVEGSGVCASSLPVWEGRDWFHYPLDPGAPGHEGWGRIDDAGDATHLKHGQRVAFLTDRAFSRHAIADTETVVPIPASLAGMPMPAEALACAVNIMRRSDVREGQTVAIIGIGSLGALLCRLASNAGARVVAISRRKFALDLALQFGAHETIAMEDHWDILRQAGILTNGKGCERVIEVVGLQWPLDLAGELVSEGGRLVIGGYHQDGPRQVNMQQWNWKGIDVINAHERDRRVVVEGMRLAIDAVAAGTLDPRPLFTHQFPLHQLDDAFRLMRNRPDGFVKALMVTG